MPIKDPDKRRIANREAQRCKREREKGEPAQLSEIGRRVWREQSMVWQIAEVDRHLFWLYCEAHADWQRCLEALKGTETFMRTSTGSLKPNPWIARADKCEARVLKLMKHLGVTTRPAARRDKIEEDDDDPDLDDLGLD